MCVCVCVCVCVKYQNVSLFVVLSNFFQTACVVRKTCKDKNAPLRQTASEK
jgi:hypothetical protein